MKSNIYITLAAEALAAPDKGMYFLSFLKVRTIARKRAGTFTEAQFSAVTGLHRRTAKTHLIKLILRGYVSRIGDDNYRIATQRSLFDHYRTEYIHQIEDEELLSYSWKNIASFRSLLAEIIISRNRKHRQTARVRSKGKNSTTNLIDSGFDLRVSLAYAKRLTGLSQSTLSKYRKRQTVSDYQYNLFVYSDAEQAIESESVLKKLDDLKGHAFYHNGKLLISEIAIRKEKNCGTEEQLIKASRIKKPKTGSKNTTGILFHKPCIGKNQIPIWQ